MENNQDIENLRCIKDLFKVYNSNLYINEKGYLQKLIDILYKRGYYKDNESALTF